MLLEFQHARNQSLDGHSGQVARGLSPHSHGPAVLLDAGGQVEVATQQERSDESRHPPEHFRGERLRVGLAPQFQSLEQLLEDGLPVDPVPGRIRQVIQKGIDVALATRRSGARSASALVAARTDRRPPSLS